MNTKTEQISSGLVAVAWMDYSCDPLVRLSDAEKLIAEKDAKIKRLSFDLAAVLELIAMIEEHPSITIIN